jgi:hypothetical protein
MSRKVRLGVLGDQNRGQFAYETGGDYPINAIYSRIWVWHGMKNTSCSSLQAFCVSDIDENSLKMTNICVNSEPFVDWTFLVR